MTPRQSIVHSMKSHRAKPNILRFVFYALARLYPMGEDVTCLKYFLIDYYIVRFFQGFNIRWCRHTQAHPTGSRQAHISWWRHQMETFSALLALYAGNSPVSGEFPAQRPVTRNFDIFFDLRLNKRCSKPSQYPIFFGLWRMVSRARNDIWNDKIFTNNTTWN